MGTLLVHLASAPMGACRRHGRARRGSGVLPAVGGGGRRTSPGTAGTAGRERDEHRGRVRQPAVPQGRRAHGNLDFVNEGGGPVCVAVWKDGADNGGATYQGVTKDSIDVVVLVPNEQQLAGVRPGQTPVDHATGGKGTVTNVFKDTFAAFEHQAHQTYGRKINLVFVTSSGDDETAQRAERGRGEGHEAVRGRSTAPTRPAGVRHRSRGGEDPGLRETPPRSKRR